MAVMRIREMRVRVPQRFVSMTVSVPSASGDRRIVLMLVVRIVVMHMFMLVFERLVHVLVFVPFRQMQPDSGSHQYCGGQQLRGDGIPHQKRQRRPEEGRDRKVRAGASGTQMA
jgi:hypothetical protein